MEERRRSDSLKKVWVRDSSWVMSDESLMPWKHCVSTELYRGPCRGLVQAWAVLRQWTQSRDKMAQIFLFRLVQVNELIWSQHVGDSWKVQCVEGQGSVRLCVQWPSILAVWKLQKKSCKPSLLAYNLSVLQHELQAFWVFLNEN